MPPEDAIAELRNAVALNPDDPHFSGELGALLIHKGDLNQAWTVLDQAIKKNPENAHVHFQLSQLFSTRREFDKAVVSARAAIRFEPANVQYWSNLGHHLALQERFEEAVAAVRKAIAIGPESAELYSTVGDLMLRLGNIRSATEAYRRSSKLDPLNSHAKQQLSRLRGAGAEAAKPAMPAHGNNTANYSGSAQHTEPTAQNKFDDVANNNQSTDTRYLPTELLKAILVNNPFVFSRIGGKIINASLHLAPNGAILGSKHPNETSWKLTGDGLVFENDKGQSTTIFDQIEATDDGEVTLLGRFLLDGKNAYIHALKKVPPRRHFATVINHEMEKTQSIAKVAVLVRTYKCDEKYTSLMSKLDNNRRNFDLYSIVNETDGREDPGRWPVVWHSETGCLDLGLTQLPWGGLRRFSDFPLYFALRDIPHYNYYIMIEDDVEFAGDDSSFLSDLCGRIADDQRSTIDLAGVLFSRNRQHIWGTATRDVYTDDNCYLVRFPFILVSRRLCAYLLSQRQVEAGRNTTDDATMHCEVFVPSAAQAAGFNCVDVNDIMPNSYDRSIMLFEGNGGYGRPMGSIFRGRDGLRMYHPVYTVDEWVRRMRARFASEAESTLIAVVDALALERNLAQAEDDRPMIEALDRLQAEWDPRWQELFEVHRCRLTAPVEHSQQWHGIERWERGPGRWTGTATTTWQLTTPYRAGTRLRVMVPVWMEATPGILGGCRLRIGSAEAPMLFTAPHLIAEVTVPEGGAKEIALIAPHVRVPTDDGTDKRILGLAIPLA